MQRDHPMTGRARRHLARVAAFLLAGACALAPLPVGAQMAPFCAAGEAPHVATIFQILLDHYADLIGDPVECAHPGSPPGDTQQRTTAGLLYLRAGTDTPVFTDGQTHYAWTGQGPLAWDGASPDAPLRLTSGGALPTWCHWQGLAPGIDGYLCAMADGTVTAWAAAGPAWVLLGTLAGPDADWSLTDAGRQLLGGSAVSTGTPLPSVPPPTPTPAAPAPTSTPPPSDLDLRVTLGPVPAPGASPLVVVGGQVCNQSTRWTASSVAVEVIFTQGGLPTTDRASASVGTVGPGACVSFSTSAFVLSAWDGIALGRTTWSWRL